MGIPERVFVQCLSQGTTSGVVAFAVIVVVVVVVVVVVDHVVVVLGARYIANEHETGSSILVILELNLVGTGAHILIRLGSQNEWDGQRDRGPEDGTIVKGL